MTGWLSCVPRKPARQIASWENYPVGALNTRSRNPLHYAVVRSCHSRPAPFRFGFRNGRSVLWIHCGNDEEHRNCGADQIDLLHECCVRCCVGCPHYACGFKRGRLTPCIHNALTSAKKSRRIRGMSALLATLLSTATDSPWARSGRVQAMASDCPRPRSVHVLGQSTNT